MAAATEADGGGRGEAMRILFFGTSDFALPVLDLLVAGGHEVAAVVTQPDRPAGRGGKLRSTPVRLRAEALGLRVMTPESCRGDAFCDEAECVEPELGVVVSYGQFLPERLWRMPQLGTVNVHASLLPRWRGAAPIQRAIMAGDSESGVTLMWIARGMDTGDVFAARATAIRDDDNAGTLGGRLATMGADLLIEWLPLLAEGRAPRYAQDEGAATPAPPITRDDRVIRWEDSAAEVWRRVRGLAPAPGAVCGLRGQPMKVLECEPVRGDAWGGEGGAGEVVEVTSSCEIVVRCGVGALMVRRAQPAGSREMSGRELQCGYRIARGESLAPAG